MTSDDTLDTPAVQDALDGFHPAVRTWFERRFDTPTAAQAAGWPLIRQRRSTLISAPTGSGKTLAAFLASIDELIHRAEAGELADETSVVYISPLKALGNDIQRNLETPLAEILAVAEELGRQIPAIRAAVRSGDTPQSQRQALVRKPPHILITTPESLYLLLTAERGRETLRNVRTVIVDEVHALARDRRGSHLALSLARLDHIRRGEPPLRIGLSATVKPIEEMARFVASTEGACEIVDLGHQRDLELAVELPSSHLEAVAPNEQWGEVYSRLAELIAQHRTTLVFVNTRRLSERVAHHLAERLGEQAVASHHGSLSKERRLKVEQRLKDGELKALVATASLELGIDIGGIDLVCQIGSPRSIATFLQRVGRSGHALGLRPDGRLFPTTRDELVECATLVRSARAGLLDRVVQPVAPLDVLAQQIVAETACEDWREDDLFALVRQAAPYEALRREQFDEVVAMLATGVGDGAGGSRPLLHRDRIHGVLRARRGSRMTALTNSGTIPEQAVYRVVAEPDETMVGTVDEDWSVESMAGDIFLLGSTSWRIKRIETDTVRVENAHGAPPTIPFWLGEAPGRTIELSEQVGQLRREVAERLDARPDARPALVEWLRAEGGLSETGALQIIDYVRATRDGLGIVPSDVDVVFERFFDDSGGMQLVVHAPFGSRINRAWGVALRKRFCVSFDFELQAAANDDAMLLSSGPQHSWPLEEAFQWVNPRNATESVEQSILYMPLFPTRWRWNATRALSVPRMRGGRRVQPFLQRMIADDLLAAVFPKVVGCQENVTGALELPDHVLVRQTMDDCLREAMDIDGLLEVLGRIERGEIRLHARDTTEPSPMAHEVISVKPYGYLDDAPLEERRTRAITLRRTLPEDAKELGTLDLDAIERVRDEAWPVARDIEEVHEALLGLVAVREDDVPEWVDWLDQLARVGRVAVADTERGRMWFASEQLPAMELLYPGAPVSPDVALPPGIAIEVEERDEERMRMLRGHAEALGPFTITQLAARTALTETDTRRGLMQVEAMGYVLQGRFTPNLPADSNGVDEFCDRRLLARIYRYTLDRLRREIDPVTAQDYTRFLFRWQRLTADTRLEGRGGLRQAIARLQGFEAPAAAWEQDLLPGRVQDYTPSWLDELCLAGETAWARLTPRKVATDEHDDAIPAAPRPPVAAATRATPVSVALRGQLPDLLAAARWNGSGTSGATEEPRSGAAAEILALLQERGALFLDELVERTRRLEADVERGLHELIATGLVSSDGFQGLRDLTGGTGGAGGRRSGHRSRAGRRRTASRRRLFGGASPAGRWALVQAPSVDGGNGGDSGGTGTGSIDGIDDLAERVAGVLLERYGVIFRDVASREPLALPWREVLRALRRMEARGTVRGGRFVSGFVGEQYALPEAVDALRRTRREPRSGERVTISAADPVNLTGIGLPGARVPAIPGRTVDFIDGLPAELVAEAAELGVSS
ncbi:MAG: DEAD/DEAH box helicase [Dehalococcoidia bacterium]|nr:DEAD/DEAH box helicase [Dehalococcoidia bacterium]